MVGFDLIEPNLKYLEEEKIDFLINQNPMDQGYLSNDEIINSAYYLERESRATIF